MSSSVNVINTAQPMDEWTVFRLTREGIAKLAQV